MSAPYEQPRRSPTRKQCVCLCEYVLPRSASRIPSGHRGRDVNPELSLLLLRSFVLLLFVLLSPWHPILVDWFLSLRCWFGERIRCQFLMVQPLRAWGLHMSQNYATYASPGSFRPTPPTNTTWHGGQTLCESLVPTHPSCCTSR